ncbi:unnamed protein product [Heterosigma akashiwo]
MRPVTGSTRRPIARSSSTRSGTSSSTKAVGATPASRSACACAAVRGKPSSSQPLATQSACARRSCTMEMISSSGTSSPSSMYSCAARPRKVCFFTSSRSMSPVLRCTRPYLSFSSSHWVPLPEAGAPLIRMRGLSETTALREMVVCWLF